MNTKFPTEDTQLLKRALRQESFRVVIIEHQNYSLIQQTKQYLQEAYPSRKIQTLKTKGLGYEALMDSIYTFEKGILLIEDTEAILESVDVSMGLNQRRDKLAGLDMAIVFFLSVGKMPIFAKKMPDIHSRISLTFNWEDLILKSENRFSINNAFEIATPAYITTAEGREEKQALLAELKLEISQTNVAELDLLDNLYVQYFELCKQLNAFTDGLEAVKTYYTILEKNEHFKGYFETMCFVNIVYAYFSEGLSDYATQKNKLEQALEMATLSKNEESIGIIKNNLAIYYENKGEYNKSLKLIKEASEHFKNTSGENSELYLNSLNSLSMIYKAQGNIKEAEKLLLELIKKHNEIFNEKNNSYAKYINNLVSVYFSQGRYEEAEKLALEVINLKEKLLGKHNLEYDKAKNNLAVIYEKIGKYEEAEVILHDSLKFQEDVFGKEHLYYAEILDSLADLYTGTKRSREAISMYQKALNIFEKTIGKATKKYFIALANLGVTYINQKKYKEAKDSLKEAYKISQEVLGENDITTLNIKTELAGVSKKLQMRKR